MNMRFGSQGLYVDHVLGWAVRIDDSDTADVNPPGTKGDARPTPAQGAAERATEGDEK